MQNILDLTVVRSGGPAERQSFAVRKMFNAGWVGRDKKALQHHIDELAKLGVPPPKHVPTLFALGNHLLTTADAIQVHGDETSGEVEYVLLWQRGEILVGVGSDHTDRRLEAHSIPKAKNLCLNVMAPTVWPYAEVRGHFEKLVLESHVVRGGSRQLYQRDACGAILEPAYWVDFLNRQLGGLEDGLVLFSGTIGTVSGLLVGDAYDFSLTDPVLKRVISHRYSCPALTGALEDY
ncbi:MAG: DUF2848 domain-containing protein [Desulfobacterales bacterium]|jgi:hypothetical protein|nr:DUF2848 domain-containing protein [Desulfobacterales bacterium]